MLYLYRVEFLGSYGNYSDQILIDTTWNVVSDENISGVIRCVNMKWGKRDDTCLSTALINTNRRAIITSINRIASIDLCDYRCHLDLQSLEV